MNIEEAKAAKRLAEAEISDALTKFMLNTGLLIEDVRLGFGELHLIGQDRVYRAVSSVTLDVRL